MSVEFVQSVKEDYIWAEGIVTYRGDEFPQLVLIPYPGGRKQYEPMKDEPALFRKFIRAGRKLPLAPVPPEALEPVRTFALEYGELGVRSFVTVMDSSLLPAWAHGNGQAWGETFNDWFCQASLMIAAMDLYETIEKAEKGNKEAIDNLRERIHLGRANGLICYCRMKGPSTTNDQSIHLLRDKDAYLRPAFRERDWKALARAALVKYVDERLDDSSAHHSEGTTYLDRGNTRATLIRDSRGSYRLGTAPTRLIGALWLQFAQMLAGKEWRECPVCETDFEVGFEEYSVGRPAKRRSARFCSDACRYMYHNKLKPRRTASGPR